MQDQDFWRRAADETPGMLNLGVGLWGNNAARKEATNELNTAQGPEYQAAMGASQGALARAGSMDPQAAAQQRYNQAQGLLKGGDAASEDQLMRMLHSRGLLGVSNFNPNQKSIMVPGFDPATMGGMPTGGAAVNPHMAAFYAARNARDGRMAYQSLDEGEAQTDRLLQRSGRLQNQANQGRDSTLQARDTIPSKAAGTAQLLKSGLGLMKETGLLKDLPGMFRSGYDWLGGKTGMWGGNSGGPEELTSFFGANRLDGLDGY
jgi:hypothetical protein